ncbi:efflux RND transporter periplasmic adaptor subunit [Planctomycetes bacterium K23_9]|uniref:HlyD family secretion protein n=1 Tax=Stieleria marina TaxID=1930275 RepID=A0A517P138_9BACT|nr:HlyD family secretion protein [Planctomycetes bacterium K23_9]
MQPSTKTAAGPSPKLVVHSAHRNASSSQKTAQADQEELQATAQIQRRLAELTQSGASVSDLAAGCLQMQAERSNVIGSLLLSKGPTGISIGHRVLKDAAIDLKAISKWLFPRVEHALAANSTLVASVPKAGFECIVVPTEVQSLCAMVTIVQAPLSVKQRSLELAIGQLQSTFLSSIANREKSLSATSQMRTTASTLELVMRTQQAATIEEACTNAVVDLKEHWKCDQVFIGLCGDRSNCKMVAASDVAIIDGNAESTMLMKNVLDECLGREAWGAWPPLPGAEPHQLLAHKQLARRDSLVISTPLTTGDGKAVGALAMVGRREMATIPNLQHFVSAVGEPLGTTLETVRQKQRGRINRALRTITSNKHRLKFAAAVCGVVGLAAVLCMPWTYTITCQSLIEPVERRFCVAPHDGLLQNTLAEPGEVVDQGQLLARMDGREILWELAGVSAEKSRAAKKRDTHLAKHETPEALMADLDRQRLENQESLLEFRESHLEMSSPINGIVLSGSLDRRENFPVSKGQVLYEIAPLDNLRIEVAIPADEIMHVEVGDQVSVYFDGFGTSAVDGVIDRLRPRAEIRGAENVFIAEVTVANDKLGLRPGMEGRAKVKTDSRSVAWIAFHRAIEQTRAALPW